MRSCNNWRAIGFRVAEATKAWRILRRRGEAACFLRRLAVFRADVFAAVLWVCMEDCAARPAAGTRQVIAVTNSSVRKK